jgi:hypothetical protein
MSNFALNCYWTYSSMFPTLSDRQHCSALCPAPASHLKVELLQQHPLAILFGGYKSVSFHLYEKGFPNACFPRYLLQPAIGEDSCR